MKIFIQLPAHLSINEWKKKFDKDQILGINDSESPYGYARLNNKGHTVEFSDSPRNMIICKIIRKLLGFDLFNVLRFRNKIFKSDIVWTHTEVEFLAVSVLLIFWKKDVKILGQSVWLLDKWSKFSFLKKMIYLNLIKRVDILTFHSILNSNLAKEKFYFSKEKIKVVKFGIPTEKMYPVKEKYIKEKYLNIVAIGNDIHRDWESLVEVCGGKSNVKLTIISTTINHQIIGNYKNIEVRTFNNKKDFVEFVLKQDLSIVPLKDNLHASGLTAIQESIIFGIPVLCSNKGGLSDYFNNEVVTFYNNLDLADIIDQVHDNYNHYLRKASNAQEFLIKENINANGYIDRQLELSKSLFNEAVI